MPDPTYKDGGMRGDALQCPWSNCFPQLYKHSKNPCTLTPFADFREVTDHIWKYHSFLLSCGHCDHRFPSAKRGESHRSDLEKIKKRHWDNGCKKTMSDPDHSLKTMTDEQDRILKSWKGTNTKDQASVKPNYESLCRSLFGDGVHVPWVNKYHYFIPEYMVNQESARLGEENLHYIRQRKAAKQLSLGTYGLQNMQNTINPLVLDEYPQPKDWVLPVHNADQDSAYGSGGTGESSAQQNSGGVSSYMNPDLDWHFSTIRFSQDTLDQRPSSIVVESWELGNPDLPSE
ncbi:hypothetical protein F5B22DRAFT_631512 [Xylaria bambusicola]|uniref:uncharacterized protein n=1 Tax=Xylaria bambusicola TaxID=326684 RepID=UPI002007D99B|nr:uncharacterized protein F5B22DRAFT_631512 [Xylaria bambusicola]KAI0502900.1 hypothetical protein F5B22DRAFT_631512 [Xylaria bambusicola]